MILLERIWHRFRIAKPTTLEVKNITSAPSELRDSEIFDIVTESPHQYDQPCKSSRRISTDTNHEDPTDERKKFAEVYAQADLECVPRLATQIRMREKKPVRSRALRSFQRRQLSCKYIEPALSGSYNVLLPLRFRDGTQWLLRLPANGGDRWDELSTRALMSEVLTMKLLYNNSTIPVPHIYSYSATKDNPVKCPYILMERLDGMPLHHAWFQQDGSSEQLNRFRQRAMSSIASAMVQLNAFTSPNGGALQNNSKSRAIEVTACKKVDFYREYDLIKKGFSDESDTFMEQGPFADPKLYFLDALNNSDVKTLSHTLQGQTKLLRIFIDWFFEATSDDSAGFVLAHPDFNFQNILVGEDGSLRGLIDFDGAAAVPRCIGCEAYPLWLTPDWDPHYWNYDPEVGEIIDEEDRHVVLPEELKRCRELYTQSIETALRNHDQSSPTSSKSDGYSRTKLSGLARSLYIAANEPISMTYNISMIMDRITSLTSPADFGDSAMRHDSGLGDIDEGSEDGSETQLSFSNEQELLKKDHVEGFGEYNPTIYPQNHRMIILTATVTSVSIPNIHTPCPSSVNSQESNTPLTVPTPATPQHTTPSPWLISILFHLLWPPAHTLLLAHWMQSFPIFPTPILFASLISTDTRPLSNIATFILAAQLFARIIIHELTTRNSHTDNHLTLQPKIHQTSENHHDFPAEEPVYDSSISHTTTPFAEAAQEHSAEDYHAHNTNHTPDITMSTDQRIDRMRTIWEEDPTYDFGLFTEQNICNALYHGELDERRLHRLKIGFWRLLEQLDGCGKEGASY